MKNSEKHFETFLQTIIRTGLTASIISILLYSFHVIPSSGKSELKEFGIIWAVVFSIVFVGHWFELFFINVIKFQLPENIYVLYVTRICYWFASSILLFIIANTVRNWLDNKSGQLGSCWTFGFLYIGIQLVMYAIMQLRKKKCFYNGVY